MWNQTLGFLKHEMKLSKNFILKTKGSQRINDRLTRLCIKNKQFGYEVVFFFYLSKKNKKKGGCFGHNANTKHKTKVGTTSICSKITWWTPEYANKILIRKLT